MLREPGPMHASHLARILGRRTLTMRRAAVTGVAALLLLCGVLLFVPRLRDARLTLGAVLARFGVLVGLQSEDLTFRSTDVSLSGTIVFPERAQPIGSVVLVHGSGRAHRMLWLARLFASEGLVVLTYDKRGVGKSGGEFQGGPSAATASNLALLAQDAAAAARVLIEQHPRTRGSPVGYVGLSQAGWIMPIAASGPPTVSFLLFFSGPVATVSEERHFSNLAENDPTFWQTHSRAEVAEYMKSVPSGSGDVDPTTALATLQMPAFWAFGGQDNIMPVDLSVTRLRELIARGQSHFRYREYPALGHELVTFDFSTMTLSQPFKDGVDWIGHIAEQRLR
jgi:pimeloyl-ACP methyl ester carboxylesterase